MTPDVLFALARQNGIALPQDDDAYESPEALLERYRRFTSLDDFLHYYYIGMSALVTAADFEALAWDYFQHASNDGVAHAELFFDPQAHTSRGVNYNTVLDGFDRACKRAERDLGITSILTSCFLRHLPPADCLELFQDEHVQNSYKSGRVRAIGLDSSEKDFPPENFTDLYAKAKALGLGLTAHSGEEGPASYISSALHNLGVTRIDHGIKLIDDPQLMETVARDRILLTVCPLSNVVLRCVNKVQDVPIRKFLDAGVSFSINSDDPAYFGGYILDNYVAVHEAFNLSPNEWSNIVRAGIDGSWCSDERKAELLRRLGNVTDEWRGKL